MELGIDTSNDMNTEYPNKIWWVGHVFFWLITGIICYFVWKNRNIKAARRHLIHSTWIGIIPVVFLSAFIFLVIDITNEDDAMIEDIARTEFLIDKSISSLQTFNDYNSTGHFNPNMELGDRYTNDLIKNRFEVCNNDELPVEFESSLCGINSQHFTTQISVFLDEVISTNNDLDIDACHSIDSIVWQLRDIDRDNMIMVRDISYPDLTELELYDMINNMSDLEIYDMVASSFSPFIDYDITYDIIKYEDRYWSYMINLYWDSKCDQILQDEF